MADEEHLNILKQDVRVWNVLRIRNVTQRIDLSKADLSKADLSRADLNRVDLTSANLRETYLYKANLSGACLNQADLQGTNLREADLREADIYGANLRKANLIEADLRRANLRKTRLSEAELGSANLDGTNLSEADLRVVNLHGARLLGTKLSGATLTGAKLYGTARDDWQIDGVKCDYVFWDAEGKQRTPADRDFRPGEFEELYKQLPTFEYIFHHGFTPIDAVVMDRVVQAINEQHPEFELTLDSFQSRGQPHAKFTVLHKEYATPAEKAVREDYETRFKQLEGEMSRMQWALEQLADRPQVVINQLQQGDNYNSGGGNMNVAKDQGSATQKNDTTESD